MLNFSRKVLCLDWDKRSLRLVVARVGKGKAVLEDAHSHRLPEGIDADEPEALGGFIKSMLERHRLHYGAAVVDVPRDRVVINRLTLPPTPPPEVAAAVRFQAMKELPFPLDAAAIDYVVMTVDENGLVTEVLLGAVTVETLDRVRQTCAAAGLTPARIGLRPYANLVSAQQVQQFGEGRVLMVDIGPGATEIDIFHKDNLAFARSANVNVPLVMDESITTDSQVISIHDVGDVETSEPVIDAAVNELLVETLRTLQAYRATESDAVVDAIIVAGGTGVESRVAERLAQRLGAPVQLFDPSGPLELPPADGPKLRSFSAALGLAWGLSRGGALALDFLNPKRPISRKETLQRRARYVLIGASAIAAIAVGLYIKTYTDLIRARNALRNENDKRATEVKRLVQLQNEIEEAQDWQTEAVVSDELLNLVNVLEQVSPKAGDELVIKDLTLDLENPKDPSLLLRDVVSKDAQTPQELVRLINAVEVAGVKPYEATLGESINVPEQQRFPHKTNIKVSLRKVKDFREKQTERAKERAKRLNKAR